MGVKKVRKVVTEDAEPQRGKVLGRGLKKDRRVTLQVLRVGLGKTQAEIAAAADMGQGDVSRLEAQSDAKVSTLERYAKALGGKLEVAITIAGRRYAVEV